ncbi:MAG: hypothetical protein HYX76_03180 [Acidobacteria bacterium]|nr:hypothetical protein [Acidobacteriota bacterium]
MACLTLALTPGQAAHIAAATAPLTGLDLIVHVPDSGTRTGEAGDWFVRLQRLGVRVGLAFDLSIGEAGRELPDSVASASRMLFRVAEATPADVPRLAFDVKRVLTNARAMNPAASIGLEGPESTLSLLAAQGVIPYLDFLVRPDVTTPGRLAASVDVWLAKSLETATLREILRAAATSSPVLLSMPVESEALVRLVRLVGELRDMFPPALAPLAELRATCESSSGPLACSARMFLHPYSLDAIALVEGEAPFNTVVIAPRASEADVATTSRIDRGTRPEPGIDGVRVRLNAADNTAALRIRGWSAELSDRFSTGVRVTGTRSLTAAEIVARHQATVARQAREIHSLIQTGSSVLTFEAPGFSAPVTISSDTIVYTRGQLKELEQRAIRVNGVDLVETDRTGVPRLPLVEPERVGVIPFSILLMEMYRYRLAGRESIDKQDCYVISFEPRGSDRALASGRAWIALDTFALVRIVAIQTALKGPIISSEQRDEYVRPPGARPNVRVLARTEAHQVYEGPGFRTPIHRVTRLTDHELNPRDFDRRIEAAHASTSVMLRETPAGWRYLRRGDAPSGQQVGGPSGRAAEVTRTLETHAGRPVRTAVVGIILDPNISVPLPFAGLNYVDFNFLNTRTQFNGFFGGSYGQVSWAVPSWRATRWQLSGNAFAIATHFNDRSFRNGIERHEENLKQRPARFAIELMRPVAQRARVRLAYQLNYTRLTAADSTARTFRVPVSPLVHAFTASIEWERGPWTTTVWWGPGRRQRWKRWGAQGGTEFDPDTRDFQKVGASAVRSFVFSRRFVGRLEGAWMDGHDLDRFSRYAFGVFENPLHGYPSASVRYDRGVLARGLASWTVTPGARLDGFIDQAIVRDPAFGARARGHTGLGAALEVPLPFGFLAAAEWGYGVQARHRVGHMGTHVIRVTGYKIF